MEDPVRKICYHQKSNVNFCLQEFSVTKTTTWKCHVDDSTEIRQDNIIGRYLLTYFGVKIEFSKNTKEGGIGPFEGCTAPMFELYSYDFMPSKNTCYIRPKDYFINY